MACIAEGLGAGREFLHWERAIGFCSVLRWPVPQDSMWERKPRQSRQETEVEELSGDLTALRSDPLIARAKQAAKGRMSSPLVILGGGYLGSFLEYFYNNVYTHKYNLVYKGLSECKTPI